MTDVIISEKKLEDMFYDHFTEKNESQMIGNTFGFKCDGILSVNRQLDLGNFGIADIINFRNTDYDGSIGIDIYEFKKDTVCKNSLIQILKYKVGLIHYFKKFGIIVGDVYLYLIGGSISSDKHFEFTPQAIDSLSIYTYDIDPDVGLTFKNQGKWGFTEDKTPKSLIKALTCVSYCSIDQKISLDNYNEKNGIF